MDLYGARRVQCGVAVVCLALMHDWTRGLPYKLESGLSIYLNLYIPSIL